MLWGFAAYIMWGFFPAFFPLLEPAAPVEILAHRFIWTLVFVLLLLLALRRITMKSSIAFAPFFYLGLLITVFLGSF